MNQAGKESVGKTRRFLVGKWAGCPNMVEKDDLLGTMVSCTASRVSTQWVFPVSAKATQTKVFTMHCDCSVTAVPYRWCREDVD